MKKGKIISITSSKGGSGKTTSTAITATTLFSNYKYNVAVIDIDPQKSLINWRTQELDLLEGGDYKLIRQYEQNMIRLDKGFCDFYELDILGDKDIIIKKIEKIQSMYDYVLLDFPGSLALNVNALRILRMIDYMFIPLEADINSFNSVLGFLNGLDGLKKANKLDGKVYPFRWKYTKNKMKEEWEMVEEAIKETSFTLMQSNIKDLVEHKRYSTIIPLQYSPKKESTYSWLSELRDIVDKD